MKLCFLRTLFLIHIAHITSLTVSTRDDTLRHILSFARSIGPVGVLNGTPKQRQQLLELARSARTRSDAQPALRPLQGTFELVYSSHPKQPSGRIVGSVCGRVTQTFFANETTAYTNAVRFGPFAVTITGQRHVVDEWTNRIQFTKLSACVCGKTMLECSVNLTGGEWEYLFLGKIVNENDQQVLVRIMETPHLFILVQEINDNE
jgi:hypothetical protein